MLAPECDYSYLYTHTIQMYVCMHMCVWHIQMCVDACTRVCDYPYLYTYIQNSGKDLGHQEFPSTILFLNAL